MTAKANTIEKAFNDPPTATAVSGYTKSDTA